MTTQSPGKILVLGAGGFIGSHLVPALLDRFEAQIDAVDLDFHKLERESPRLSRHSASIDSPGLLERLVPEADLVLSLTALCNPALYNTSPLAVIDSNYTDLVPLVKLCAKLEKRLIHFSTCEVYGRLGLDLAGHETHEMSEDTSGLFLGPVARERWSYACAKQLLERVIWAHGAHRGLEFTIVRPFNVIGARMDFLPGVDGEGVPRVLACFMSALLNGEELCLVDGGHQRRSFVAIDEFVNGVIGIIVRRAACRGQIVNLGNPSNDVAIRELGAALADVFARRVPSAPRARFREVTAEAFYGAGYDDSERRIPDIRKATALLDWRPVRRLAEMLPEIVDDYVTRYGLSPARNAERSVGVV
jgi:UDP-apiose/xylose synthase